MAPLALLAMLRATRCEHAGGKQLLGATAPQKTQDLTPNHPGDQKQQADLKHTLSNSNSISPIVIFAGIARTVRTL